MLGLAGVTAMDFRVSAFTVRGVSFKRLLPAVALIVAVPDEMPVARPVLSTVATN